jgi:hypothetical protein
MGYRKKCPHSFTVLLKAKVQRNKKMSVLFRLLSDQSCVACNHEYIMKASYGNAHAVKVVWRTE